jgi:hypothetical protein
LFQLLPLVICEFFGSVSSTMFFSLSAAHDA